MALSGPLASVAASLLLGHLPQQRPLATPRPERLLPRRALVVASARPPQTAVLLYHKPPGLVVSHDDELGRPTVYAGLAPPAHGRWDAVGRLDLNPSGLLEFQLGTKKKRKKKKKKKRRRRRKKTEL